MLNKQAKLKFGVRLVNVRIQDMNLFQKRRKNFILHIIRNWLGWNERNLAIDCRVGTM